MSGRIRTFKPELLDQDRYAELTDAAKVLFQGAVLNADDRGNCPAGTSWIAGHIFHGRPKSKIQVGKLVHELEAAGLIDLYKVDGGPYMAIVGWNQKGSPTYQRIDKPQPPKYPLPKSVRSWNAFADGSETRRFETKGTENERESDACARTPSPPDPEPSPAPADALDQEDEDQEAEHERSPGATPDAPADPDPAPDRGAAVRRLIAAAWQLAGDAFQKLGKGGIDPTAPDAWSTTPPADAPPMRALMQIAEQLLDQHRTEEAALSVIRHRVEVARAEGYSKATRRWMAPMSMWNAKSFAIACEKSPEQFRPQSAGPRQNASNEQLHKTRNVTAEERAEAQAELATAMQELGFAPAQGDQKL